MTTTQFQQLLTKLSTTSLDLSSKITRTTLLNSITNLIKSKSKDDGRECRVALCSFVDNLVLEGGDSNKGSSLSLHANKRLCVVLQVGIISELDNTTGDTNVDNTASNGNEDLLNQLCTLLCKLLSSSNNINLLNDVITALQQSMQGKDTKVLYEQFVKVASSSGSKENGGSDGIIYPALSIASTLYPTNNDEQQEEEKLTTLFTTTTFSSSNFPTTSINTSIPYIQTITNQSTITNLLLPILTLKIRSHPDKVLPLVQIILNSLVIGNKVGITLSGSEGDEGNNLLNSLVKHLKSSKVDMRTVSWRCLILLAQLNCHGTTTSDSGGSDDANVVKGGEEKPSVTSTICKLLSTAGTAGLSTSELRTGAYATLLGIGLYLLQSIDNFDESNIKLVEGYVNQVLTALSGSLPKDKNSTSAEINGTMNSSAKEIGINSLLIWMQLAKKVGATSSSTTCVGYDKALDYFIEPINKYNVKDGEFRLRMGMLIVSDLCPGYLSDIAGIGSNSSNQAVMAGGESFIESVIVDLIEKKNIQKGLETIVDASIKKHSSSDAVPQVDGLLSIFALTLYNSTLLPSSSSSKKFVMSPTVSKVIAAGGTVKGHETTFLYSPTLLEAAKSDVLLNYTLHRIIALQCKIISKSSEDSGNGGKAPQPLVRVVDKRLEEGHVHPYSAATRALAVCVANPQLISSPRNSPSSSSSYSSIHASIKTVVTYSPISTKSSDALLYATFVHVNELSLLNEETKNVLNETRDKRELFDPVDETYNKLPATNSCGNKSRGRLSDNSHQGYDPSSIRCLANSLMTSSSSGGGALWRAVVLCHAGTTKRSNRRQRVALVSHMLDKITNVLIPFASDKGDSDDGLANFIAQCAASSTLEVQKKKDEEGYESNEPQDKAASSTAKGVQVSPSIHEAATSLINTLGGIAGNFDIECDDAEDDEKKPYAYASKLCVEQLPSHLVSHLTDSLKAVESLSEEDVALFSSPKGVLFEASTVKNGKIGGATPSSAKPVEKKKGNKKKGGGGFNTFEDEEWERQVKKDLEKKKKAQSGSSSSTPSEKALTPQQKELLNEQSLRREEISSVVNVNFPRVLATIRCLCESDIEVGNQCLTTFGQGVIAVAVSSCSAVKSMEVLKNDSFDTLATLASCVYEIDEVHASTMARALVISFRDSTNESGLKVSALPSPCAPAAVSIFEMEDYGDCLSGNSFAFLFPIIRAALTGPRNIPGCDDALRVLDRHCAMLAGDEEDATVKALRKDMASTVLGLLLHDRSQTFVNPTPYEALLSCYVTNEGGSSPSAGAALAAPEVAPLLGDRGALGNDNTRVASMEALASIAEHHPKLVILNPLMNSRVWLNCYEEKKRIKTAARKAWLVAQGHGVDVDVESTPLDAPSKMYAVPLLPLLSHEDSSIATAAATSLSYAMGMNPETAEKNIVKLCNTFLASFPAPGNEDVEQPKQASTSPFPVQPPPVAKKAVKKKVIDTGLPKKKKKTSAVSGSMAKITGAPAPRKSAATKKLLAKTVAPKKERTLDQGSLMDQFKVQSKETVKKVAAEEDSDSKIAVRLGVLRAISALTDSSANVKLDLPLLKILIGFLMAYGLGDGNEGVRNASRNAARDIVAHYGSSDDAIAEFLPQFESVLKSGQVDTKCVEPLSTEKIPTSIAASDYRKEGIVVSLGSIALHLKNESDNDKIDNIIDMLIDSLSTPSEEVQSSVALCLSKLMKKGRTQERIETLLNDLMVQCIEGSSLASRRGAAYGISAAVKGSGIASLKKYAVVSRLEESCTTGNPNAKEGSLFCIELLSSRLGILFEPYVIVLLPALLKAFSDSNDYVRAAADKTVGQIMGKLSGHGVKLVMPAVLDAFNEPEWRTKQASIHMLGSMSHCAPKQLASCLPKVVPKLTEAFSDTHPKVKHSAEEALEEICKVIKNPEIAEISDSLLKALTDATATLHALEELISTEFVHAIDAPSLSIIIPVVHRGLRDRAATTKRYSALISGNICTMVNDPRDFVPYLPILLPDLKSTLLDPIPDVRSISAKSLGSLTRGLGEATFPDLRPWLIDTLRSEEGSSVERSGAAQGLSEVLVAGGAQLTENVMVNEILPLKSHPKAGTREGVLWVLTFLPSVLGQAYSSLIDESLPALLGGLADDNESVRDVALRAGRVLVRSHGKAHKDKILPSLEQGLSNEDYRIRVASLTLLGDLLGMLGGTKVGKTNTDTQDDIRQAERAQAQIALALGNETRKRVLGSLYLARSDTAAVVRQSAVQVWKTVVSVTPRTLREILSVLVDQIVTTLASGDSERTQVAGRCLGDIVHKLGDQVLPEIIPVLRDNLYKGDEFTRQGVCVGLAEVINCSSKEQITKYLDILVKVVQDALCDEDSEVRTMAASCFQNLYNVVGNRTLDEIVPALLVAMESDDDEAKTRALNGMTGILGVRSRELLPYIIPRLLKTPLSISHADALGSISAATSETIHYHFSSILPTIIMELASFSDADLDEEEKEREEAIRRCCRSVCHNVDNMGINWLVSEIASKCTHDKESVRKEACWSFQVLVEERKKAADFYEQVPVIIRELLHRLNDDSTVVLKANHKALGALTSCVPAEELVTHIQFIRNLIASMVSDARYRKGGVGDGEFFLPGFNMPKGLEPLLPIYQRGILYGNADVRECAAAGLGELIVITANKYLAGPFLIKLTGPLLRIVGDRNPSAVKIAIVQTLGLILTKGGPALRAFVPQFQTTFVKALSDPSRQVRVEAIKALALLMPLSTRVDPLIKELVSTSLGKGSSATVETAGIIAIQTASLEALAVVLKHGGSKVKVATSVPSSLDAAKELVNHEDDGIRDSAAKVMGYACELLGTEEANAVVQEFVLDKVSSSASLETKHGIACICRRIFSRTIGKEIDRSIYKGSSDIVETLMKDDKVMVKEAACVAIGAILGSSTEIKSTISLLEKSIMKCMDTKEELNVQQAVANGLSITARLQPGIFRTQDGLTLINGALKLSMSGAQRVQYTYNDFLWLALDVKSGDDSGLEEYLAIAHFDSAKKMQAIYSKVVKKIKSVNDEEL